MSKKPRRRKVTKKVTKKPATKKKPPAQPTQPEPIPEERQKVAEQVVEEVAEEAKVETEAPIEAPAEAPAPPKEPEAVEEEIEIVEERMIPINLSRVWNTPRTQRAPKAIRVIRDVVKRHMKVSDVKISNDVNEKVWFRSIEKPPRKIDVRAVKDKDGNVIVFSAR